MMVRILVGEDNEHFREVLYRSALFFQPIRIPYNILTLIQIRSYIKYYTYWKTRLFLYTFIHSGNILNCFIFLVSVIGVKILNKISNILDSVINFRGIKGTFSFALGRNRYGFGSAALRYGSVSGKMMPIQPDPQQEPLIL